MQKVVSHFVLLVVAFFLIWIGLSQISFVNRESLDELGRDSEAKLGELILKSIESSSNKVHSIKTKAVIDSIKNKLCQRNNIDSSQIKIHLFSNTEINAFALPDNHMVIYTGLLKYAKDESELAGVMAHEIGHMQKKHVSKKLIKEIGLSMLMTIAGGDAGPEIAKEIVRTLSSSSFDRSLEREADEFAVEATVKAGFNPEGLANFLFRISQNTTQLPDELEWISTHPDSKDRAADILKKRKKLKVRPEPCIKTPWKDVQDQLDQDL